MEGIGIYIVFAAVFFILVYWLTTGVKFVGHKTYHVLEIFGKYERIMKPGLNLTWPAPISKISSPQSMQVFQLEDWLGVKSKDDVFVTIPVVMQLQVIPGFEKDAYYELYDPKTQLKEYVTNTIRKEISEKDVYEIYSDKGSMQEGVMLTLTNLFAGFGWRIIDVLINEPKLPQTVEDSYNAIRAAEQDKVAAEFEREAIKTRAIGQAEGEAEALRLKGEGHRAMREALAEGIVNSLKKLKESGLTAKSSQEIFTQIDRMDALRDTSKGMGSVIVMDLNSQDSKEMGKLVGALEASKKSS